MSFDTAWNTVHRHRPWGKWPSTRFVEWTMRNYGQIDTVRRARLKFLELGCGAGAQMRFLKAEGFDVTGIDGSADAIGRASTMLTAVGYGPPHALRCADIDGSLLGLSAWDCVVDVATLQHLPEDRARVVLYNAWDSLVPGGRLFSMMASVGSTAETSSDTPLPRLATFQAIQRLFAGLGDWQWSQETVTSPEGFVREHWIVTTRKESGECQKSGSNTASVDG